MRLESVPAEQIPADLGAWYVDVYNRVGVSNYQGLAYHAPHEFDRLRATLEVICGIDGRGACLEVGCSNGIITKELSPLFGTVTAIDINPAAFAVAPALPNVEYRQADIEALELDGLYDVVLLSDVLEHLREPAKVIQKCAAHARWVVGVGPTTEPINPLNAFKAELLGHGWAPGDGTGHIWYMDVDGFLSLFEGLRVEKVARGGEHHTVVLARGLA